MLKGYFNEFLDGLKINDVHGYTTSKCGMIAMLTLNQLMSMGMQILWLLKRLLNKCMLLGIAIIDEVDKL